MFINRQLTILQFDINLFLIILSSGNQIALDKVAEEYRDTHKEREELLRQWEAILDQMKRRDGAIEATADELGTLKAEISERENALDEKKDFLNNEEGIYIFYKDIPVIRIYICCSKTCFITIKIRKYFITDKTLKIFPIFKVLPVIITFSVLILLKQFFL